MTTEEKLSHFQSSCLDDATKQGEELLEKYQKYIEDDYNTTKQKLISDAEYHIKTQTTRLTRENNKLISDEQFKLMHEFSVKNEEYKDMIFVELKDKLEKFMSTREYFTLLCNQIKEAKKVASGKSMIVYIDPADEHNLHNLEIATGENVEIYEKSFGGGTIITIPSRNILIDNSFDGKISKIRANFSFKAEAI